MSLPRAADPAREVAYEALRAVREDDAYANLAMPSLLAPLGTRDAAFATELVYGTLRARGSYDEILARCVTRPLDKLDPRVLDVLRLGAHQLLGMRVAAHAAVDSSVKLVRAKVGHGPAGLVNAVLRKVAARDLAGWLAAVAPTGATDPVGRLAVTQSHPRWVVEAFRDALGGDLAETETALAADNERPVVTLVARPGKADLAELFALGAQPGRWSPVAAVLESGGSPSALPPVRENRAGVQDEGSQLVTLALAAAPIEGRDERWLDMCAGPGGKAALLGALAEQRGATLVAAELQPHRARLVARVVGSSAVTVVADGTVPAWAPGAFDRVLVDAPCTGLGALRRRPEARWRRLPSDVDSLHPLQISLLRSAIQSVRPGGVVAYVTCSPHVRETRDVVREVVGPDVERIDARPFLPGVADLGDGPAVQLWPHLHGTDAMYLTLLRKRASG